MPAKPKRSISTCTVNLRRLYISPGHNYWFQRGNEPGSHPVHRRKRIQCVAGHGIRGDRFFDFKNTENHGCQITFLSWEVYRQVAQKCGTRRPPSWLRRNVVISGVALNQLIGREFYIGNLRFGNVVHCTPCSWMDIGFARGAWNGLAGRGGLRCTILKGGVLNEGRSVLSVDGELDNSKKEILKTLPGRPRND